MRVPITYPGTKQEDRPMGSAPLSPAVRLGNTLFISGQVAIDPITGAIVGDDVATQTHQVLTNIKTLVEAAGLTMKNVGKVGIFLTDVADFDTMNAVYAEFFDAPFPARATVGITLNNPSLLVEMDAIAVAV
ncbi:Rid family detoxifying hydrolase [Microvirga lotononidis]|uniref:Endoribonuclease L-PSP, putative n=1 Tax=Microvirga lotononidis TaxID=864069 RepID=I4YUE7_9HYPH|nr:Rid family detoxifying hydrolase [Microvirga lotononidis]EIM27589.1 endoribonuclease L-PSP, putative [Microvirga lotononidis]WQO28265.1 Rid family detoxifying hydrolase [Microvirga lotononidis]